jgi:hypothetical protein
MTLASISSSTAATASNSWAASAPRRHRADDDKQSAPPARSDGPGRRNPLVAAMLSALQSLLPSPAATPTAAAATTTTASASATSTTGTEATLRDAAYAFAHELFSALRGNTSGARDEGDAAERPQRHHHHHHHHRSDSSRGYDDLAQRLTALAQKLDGGAPAATSSPAAATPVTQPTATASPEPTVASTASSTINITININLGGTAAATAAPKSTASPLVDAFKHLFDALNPSAAASGTSPAERLAAFLRQMAQSLGSAGSNTTDTPTLPRSGSLLSVSA